MTVVLNDFDYLREVVLEQSAIVLAPGKEYLVESRMLPLAKEQGFGSIGEMVDRLRAAPTGDLRRLVVEAMTTNETFFFRDLHPFDALREHVIPSVMKARSSDRALHVWCAACSTGQEPYSIAMMLKDSFRELSNWSVQITATDLSEEVLAKAREGCFSQIEVNRGLPASLLVKHFAQTGTRWCLKPEIRQLVSFRQLNLVRPWPGMPKMDVVFLRNVLIYFDVEAKQRILAAVRRLLRPDGHLFLGAAETTLGLSDEFERLSFGKAICYKPKTG